MIEWWSEISKRAQSSTFTQPGDGSLDAISRSGSIVKSSSVIAPKSPELHHSQGPSPPYVSQELHAASPVVAAAVAQPEVTTAPASPVLELLRTESSSSLTHAEPSPPVIAAAPAAPAPAPAPVAAVTP